MQPMLAGSRLYFLSDRGSAQRANIWVCDLDGDKKRQITKFKDYDITFPSIGPSEIVFQAGGRLYLLGLKNEKVNEVFETRNSLLLLFYA